MYTPQSLQRGPTQQKSAPHLRAEPAPLERRGRDGDASSAAPVAGFGHHFGRVAVHAGSGAPSSPVSGLLQRACACGSGSGGATSGNCAACAERASLQRKGAGPAASAEAPPVVHDVLRAPGQPLDAPALRLMEAGFHRSFDQVRIHTDDRAASSARAVNALAYTVGNHVVFDRGQYDATSRAGQRLLAHELTHVVQQQSMGPRPQAKLAIGDAGDAAEHEADRTADAVVSGAGADKTSSPDPTPIKRQFRAAAISYLSCAECNPYSDDGLTGLSPPNGELYTASLFRMKHVVEAELDTNDGRTIVPGSAQLAGSSRTAGISGFCGEKAPATIVSYTPPTSPTLITSKVHGEGMELTSDLTTRVDVPTPATLPGSPCGHTGNNPLIPAINNKFRVRLYADGTKESAFLGYSPFPYHYMYHDTKVFRDNHPATDFEAWATSTGLPLTASILGFKALRFACCNPITAASIYATVCIGGISVPLLDPISNLPLHAHLLELALMDCGSPCGNAGAPCLGKSVKPAEGSSKGGGGGDARSEGTRSGGGGFGGGGSGSKW